MSASTTRALRRPSSRAVANPMPLAPPVMTAPLPSSVSMATSCPDRRGDGQNRVVQFSPELRERVADGTITVSYRLWSRPQAKVGGTYNTAGVTIEVDD